MGSELSDVLAPSNRATLPDWYLMLRLRTPHCLPLPVHIHQTQVSPVAPRPAANSLHPSSMSSTHRHHHSRTTRTLGRRLRAPPTPTHHLPPPPSPPLNLHHRRRTQPTTLQAASSSLTPRTARPSCACATPWSRASTATTRCSASRSWRRCSRSVTVSWRN